MSNVIELGLNPLVSKASPAEVFNSLDLYYRVCVRFCRKSPEEESICVCNRRKDEHKGNHKESENTEWIMEYNTEKKENPPYGKLQNGAWFTRLALDTPEQKVEKILRTAWQIDEPRFIMSIIGGAKYFKLSDRLEASFINGIIDVALKSGAWLITNGYNVGIVQLVGQAINKVKLTMPGRKIIAIGLCKWGSVKDVEKLIEARQKKKQKSIDKQESQEDGEKPKKRESGQRDLEMNHSHYIMLDDGTIRNYDVGDYRTRLCVHLGRLNHEVDVPTPVVTIVVEGGRDTVASMYHDLRKNIPVVIIDGSGRVADFFKRWLMYTKEFDDPTRDTGEAHEISEIHDITPVQSSTITQRNSSNSRPSYTTIEIQLDKSQNQLREMFKKYEDQMRNDLSAIINHENNSPKRQSKAEPSSNSKDKPSILETTLRQTMYCLQPAVRSGISVFNLNSDDDLSETIFRSICKSRQKYFERKRNEENDLSELRQRRVKSPQNLHDKKRHSEARRKVNTKEQNVHKAQLLDLAMDWNCIDAAKELILENSLDNILNKERTFIQALNKNLPIFVYEFLNLNIDPVEIFFPNDEYANGTVRYEKFIQALYSDKAVNDRATHLQCFIEATSDTEKKHIRRTSDLNDVLSTLIGDYMSKLYFDNRADEIQYRRLWGLNEESIPDYSNDRETTSHENENEREYKEKVQDCVMRDLFLWSILMNHIDMAKVFLSHMKYQICASLIATKILKQYYTKATYGEIKDNYLVNANYFEQYAIDCITQCEKNDPDKACQIILQRIELYGNVTCIQVAADAHAKLFISTPCCVEAMNNVWYDKISPEQSRKRHITSLIVGFLTLGLGAPFLVTYRPASSGFGPKVPTPTLESYGIDYSDPYPLQYPRYTKVSSINEYMHRVKNFHKAPLPKYAYHCLYYFIFLLLFSYLLLFNFQPPTNKIPSIHWTEILTIFLVTSMLIEEILYFFNLDNLKLSGKCFSYFSNVFKLMTAMGFILFYIGLILRFGYATPDENFIAARIVMAIDLEIWWLRSLSFIIVIKFLGPHIVAIGKMLKDLAFFMFIILIVMSGYGIASRSMAHYANPDAFSETNTTTAFDGRSVFRQIAYPVYYLMYGEFGNELSDLDENSDAGWAISTHVLLAFHMLFVNVLLINLLIAMFSKRYDQVYEDTHNIWHSQKYIFTREYYTRSPFFPPISLFLDLYYLCRLMFFKIRRTCFKKSAEKQAKVFKMIPVDQTSVKGWYEFEGASTYEYAHQEVKAAKIAASKPGSYHSSLEKREMKSDIINDINNPNINLRQVQDDIAKLNQSYEDIKGQLKMLIETVKGRNSNN